MKKPQAEAAPSPIKLDSWVGRRLLYFFRLSRWVISVCGQSRELQLYCGLSITWGWFLGVPSPEFLCLVCSGDWDDSFRKLNQQCCPCKGQGCPWAHIEKHWPGVVLPWGSASFEQKEVF